MIYLGETYRVDIQRWGWRLWSGSQVAWRGLIFDIGEDHFIFPGHDEDSIIIGRFDEDAVTFPSTNVLRLAFRMGEAERRAKTDFTAGLHLLCEKRDCDILKAEKKNINGALVECVQFNAGDRDMDLWDNRRFHRYCYPYGSDIVISYAGTEEKYAAFAALETAALTAIVNKLKKQTQ